MKHSTIVTVLALAWAARANAQQAPPAEQAPPAGQAPASEPAPPAGQAPAAEPAPAAEQKPKTEQAPANQAPAAEQPQPPNEPAAEPEGEPAASAQQPEPQAEAKPAETPAPAQAEEKPWQAPAPETPAPAKAPEQEPAQPQTLKPLLGLGVAAPDTGPLPGRIRPSFGVPSVGRGDYRFDFHGYLAVPFRFGINERENPYATQYSTVLHAPPLVPDDFSRFEHTGVMQEPWVQLNFSYGNNAAVATVIVAARSVSGARGFFNPPDQLGINDAFLTFKPNVPGVGLEIDVGGFSNRYGGMGDYDLGRYDTPVIARVSGVGETTRFSVPLANELVFLAEHGVMGQFDRAQLGVPPAAWNDFADPNVGTSFAHHAHLGLARSDLGQIGLHYVSAFTRDDRTAPTLPDGSITVLGADVRAEFGAFGRLYLGTGYTDAETARSVSSVIRVLNARGGPGLRDEYFGPNSDTTGTLLTVGAQYDVSIGEIVRRPQPFSGYGPDLVASFFTLFTHVGSEDDAYDGVDKVKYGTEVTYSMLPWLAASARYDRVIADTDDAAQTFAILSPRIILRTDYNSQDQVTLQYSHWFYGSGVNVVVGYPPREDPSVVPDADTLSLTANMWW